MVVRIMRSRMLQHPCTDLVLDTPLVMDQLIVIQTIATYHNTGEINFKIAQKVEAMEALKSHFTSCEEVVKYMDFDGFRIEFQNWWFNVRPSNTEPYLRLLMEAKTKELLDQKLKEAKK